MQVQKPLALKKAIETAVAELAKLNFDPLKEIVDILKETRPVPADKEVLRSMLWSDWEYTADGQSMQRKGRMRLEAALDILPYVKPRIKPSEDKGGPKKIEINVKYKQGEPKPTAVIRTLPDLPKRA